MISRRNQHVYFNSASPQPMTALLQWRQQQQRFHRGQEQTMSKSEPPIHNATSPHKKSPHPTPKYATKTTPEASKSSTTQVNKQNGRCKCKRNERVREEGRGEESAREGSPSATPAASPPPPRPAVTPSCFFGVTFDAAN